MYKICLKPFNNKVFFQNRVFRINNGHNIFYNFDKILIKSGAKISTHDLCKKGNFYVYCDVPYPWMLREWVGVIGHIRKNILFCFESPLVNPFNHFSVLRFFFNKIYTWNDKNLDNRKYYKFCIPQLDQPKNVKETNFVNKKFSTMVCAKKSALLPFKLLSPYKEDLYKERLSLIEHFEKNNSNIFDLHGVGWNRTGRFTLREKLFGFKRYRVYKGEVKDKIGVLSKYKFCFAIENASAPGYITEKIFDCFKAGCVPVYRGAPNVEKYIPRDCFIDMRKYGSYEELLDYLNSIDEKKYKKYITDAKTFLGKKKTLDAWFEKGFEKIFWDAICKI